jgi:rhodanese-related sulfurtransferase
MLPEIDLQAFAAAHADGAFVLDVREPAEYVEGHVPGTRLIPLAQVLARRAELPPGERVFVICASGNRSRSATDWLHASGVDAVSVAGGTSGWVAQGRPVVRGPHASESAA